jgi:hypothetical protein
VRCWLKHGKLVQLNEMSAKTNNSSDIRAKKWAARLMKSVNAVLKKYPHADPDNVRHTLILLEKPPLERLGRSLLRGRAITQRK